VQKRKRRVEKERRLATLMPPSYTYSFRSPGFASVAQWQSTGFVNRWLWVQLPPLASARNACADERTPPGLAGVGGNIIGQMAERPMAPDCKSGEVSSTQVRILLCPNVVSVDEKARRGCEGFDRRGCSSIGRAVAFQATCWEFESPRPLSKTRLAAIRRGAEDCSRAFLRAAVNE
jgi:hypothetical protein